jgi:small subunit ribosomal protein S6
MQTYETVFITRPTLTEDEEKSTVETLLQIVTGGGGTVTVNDRMGRRRLAYPIMKQMDGVYVRFLYDSEAEVPKELERRMRLSDDVLRAMTVRLEPNWAVAAKEQAVRDEETRIENERLERERAIEAAAEAAEAARKAAEEPAESEEDPAPVAEAAGVEDATPTAPPTETDAETTTDSDEDEERPQ